MILSRRAVHEDPADGILILCFLLFMFIMGLAFLLPSTRRSIPAATLTGATVYRHYADGTDGSGIVIVDTYDPNTSDSLSTGGKVEEPAEATSNKSSGTLQVSGDDERETRRQMSEAVGQRMETLKAFLRAMTHGWLESPTGSVIRITTSVGDELDAAGEDGASSAANSSSESSGSGRVAATAA